MKRWMAALTSGMLALTVVIPATLAARDASALQNDAKPKPGAAGARGRGGRMQELIKKLNLTPDQQTKLQAAFKEQQESRRGLRDLPQDQRREKAKASRDAFQAKLKTILTPEQQKKLQEEMQKARAERGAAGAKKPGKPNNS